MEHIDFLIVGAGVSGLAAAAALAGQRRVVLEADAEIGGYCKTVQRAGFVWDYSGHFFHFKHPEIERWLRERMPGQVRTVQRRSFIDYHGQRIDFPFQKNIHQLPRAEFIECLYDLYFADLARREGKAPSEHSFRDMLYARFGRGISEKFLVPYNEKLYACDLGRLDKDAMGRFFPHAQLTDIIRNMREPDNAGYNQTFTYPEGGAIEYVKALASEVPAAAIACNEALLEIDLATRTARTSRRSLRFEHLISSMPFNRLLACSRLAHDPSVYSWNKVLVFNLGFDRKGPSEPHWIYYPSRDLVFYRVGFYDNIFDSERMSLYVEIGLPADAQPDVAALRQRALADLHKLGLVQDHVLVADHHVVMDPAYVHITQRSLADVARTKEQLRAHGVHSIGRYGGWTYCSIEDNIVEARALVTQLMAAKRA
ncbi:MAG TPA: FAD-dependent oxidoreductase [Polyangiales bacterium]|nr:FAD-dependent oxidoreductase [Polyangiales bacterium]